MRNFFKLTLHTRHNLLPWSITTPNFPPLWVYNNIYKIYLFCLVLKIGPDHKKTAHKLLILCIHLFGSMKTEIQKLETLWITELISCSLQRKKEIVLFKSLFLIELFLLVEHNYEQSIIAQGKRYKDHHLKEKKWNSRAYLALLPHLVRSGKELIFFILIWCLYKVFKNILNTIYWFPLAIWK